MRIHSIATAAALVLSGAAVFLAGSSLGQGSHDGRPAASSQNANPDRSGMTPSKSGSGTSTSGGRDDNGDQGRDKMPESNTSVKPSSGKPDIPDPSAKK